MLDILLAGTVFSIPAGPAGLSLNMWGAQSGMQLVFNFEEMRGIETHAIEGELDNFDALDALVAGARIRYKFVNGRTVTLTVDPPPPEEGPATWRYSYEGWYYSCLDFGLVSGFMLTRSQRLAWNIAVATGKIPPDQMWCTRDVPIPPGETPQNVSDSDEQIIVQANPRRRWWQVWKPR